MEKGFYAASDPSKALEDPQVAGAVFLHGHCGFFALALHDTYGYKIGWILDDDEANEAEDPWSHLVHIFCYEEVDGELVYIDVRGCQSDERKFEGEFDDFFVKPNYDFGLSYDDIRDELGDVLSKDQFNEIYAEAVRIIDQNRDIYWVN